MATKNYLLAGEGTLWVQPDGPNTAPRYLGCHNLGDVTEPLGDVTLIWCPDPAIPNKWTVVGSFQGAPGPVTTSVEADVQKTADYLEQLKCPASLYIGKVSCGRKNVFSAYDRLFVMERAWVTQRGLSNMVAKNPEDQERSAQSFEISSESMLRIFQLVTSRVPVSQTESLETVTSCDSDICAGDCGDAVSAGDTLYAGGGLLAGSAGDQSEVQVTTDGGSTWSAAAARPFAAAISIGAIVCVPIDRDTTRIIVARGTTQANTNIIAFSNDGGATWSFSAIAGTSGDYATGPKALFALDYYNIFLVTSAGEIYKSEDGGVTWAAQSSGVVTALNAVQFSDSDHGYAVGASNVVLKTVDGGTTWSAVTAHTDQAGDSITALRVHNSSRVFVGYNDGELYYTHNGGTNWYRRAHPLSGAGSIPAMDWVDEYVGYVLHNTSAPVGTILYTVDGGYSWESLSTVTNTGLNDIKAINESLAFAVGEPQGGTAVVVKVSAQ